MGGCTRKRVSVQSLAPVMQANILDERCTDAPVRDYLCKLGVGAESCCCRAMLVAQTIMCTPLTLQDPQHNGPITSKPSHSSPRPDAPRPQACLHQLQSSQTRLASSTRELET